MHLLLCMAWLMHAQLIFIIFYGWMNRWTNGCIISFKGCHDSCISANVPVGVMVCLTSAWYWRLHCKACRRTAPRCCCCCCCVQQTKWFVDVGIRQQMRIKEMGVLFILFS